jgi:hypothetical protein
MNQIKAWIADHKISSHAIAGMILSAAGLYVGVPQVKVLVDGLLATHKTISAIFGALIGIYLRYSQSQKN